MDVEKILNDEVSLAALGYADLESQSALLGAIQAMPVAQRAAAIKKIVAPKSAIPSGMQATGRDEVLRRLDGLPQNIIAGLMKKNLQLADSAWYVVKAAGGVTEIRMLQNIDTKAPGVGNVSFQKLDKDFFFLPIGIQLLSGVNANPLLADFGLVNTLASNGEFEFKANGKYMMPKDTSCQIFDTSGRTDVLVGYHRVHNPKWIEPGVDVIFDIRFSDVMTADTALKLVFHGVTVIPY